LIDASKPFERCDFRSCYRADWRDARTDRLPFYNHGACPALAQTTTEFRPAKLEIVAQNVEQRRGRIHVQRVVPAVDFESDRAHMDSFRAKVLWCTYSHPGTGEVAAPSGGFGQLPIIGGLNLPPRLRPPRRLRSV